MYEIEMGWVDADQVGLGSDGDVGSGKALAIPQSSVADAAAHIAPVSSLPSHASHP